VGNKIGRITPAGAITEFSLGAVTPLVITSGPGGLWFTEGDGNQIGRITTAGAVSEYPVPTGGSVPEGITTGPDGNVWFTESQAGKIGKLATGFSVPALSGWGMVLCAMLLAALGSLFLAHRRATA
jgi:streptogramin lyase